MQLYPASYLLLTALAALSPLPFGGDSAWGKAALAVGLMAAMCLWAGEVKRGRVQLTIAVRHMLVLILCYTIVVLWGLAQLSSSYAILPLLSYAIAFWLAAQFGRSEMFARRLLQVIAVAITLYGVYGLVMALGGMPYVLWMEKTHYRDVVTATFISRNNCGTYLAMGMLVTIALLVRQVLENTRGHRGNAFFRQMLENIRGRTLLYMFVLLMQGAALTFTFSRSGMLAFALGLAALTILICLFRPFREQRFMLLAGAVTITGVTLIVLALGMKGANSRWDSLQNSLQERKAITDGAWELLKEEPLRGYGLGNFERAYAPTIDEELRQRLIDRHDRMDHAHNSYLQLMVELGIPATVLLILCQFMVAWRCVRGVVARRFDGIYPALGGAVCVLMGSQALFDYALEIPAISFTYALVLGVAWAQAFSSWEDMA